MTTHSALHIHCLPSLCCAFSCAIGNHTSHIIYLYAFILGMQIVRLSQKTMMSQRVILMTGISSGQHTTESATSPMGWVWYHPSLNYRCMTCCVVISTELEGHSDHSARSHVSSPQTGRRLPVKGHPQDDGSLRQLWHGYCKPWHGQAGEGLRKCIAETQAAARQETPQHNTQGRLPISLWLDTETRGG